MKICMIVPKADVKGGIASVVNGYRKHGIDREIELSFVESYQDGGKWQKLGKAVKGYLQFVRKLVLDKPDMVHIHSSFGPSFYRKIPFIYLAKLGKIKIINHIHGAEFSEFYLEASGRKKALVKKIYEKCDILLVLSQEWKEKIGVIVDKEKIRILENYCQIPTLRKEEKKRQILFMGEIGGRKGCFDIPQIYQKVVEQTGPIPLIIAGEGETQRVQSMLKERGLLDTVVFPGWVRGEEKEKLLRESKYFLFPSYNEGMPMVILEAMSYGMGIVTSNVGGIPQLIKDGTEGYICTPGDYKNIAEKLIKLIEEEEILQSCGEGARKKVIEQYSFESHISKLREIYFSMNEW